MTIAALVLLHRQQVPIFLEQPFSFLFSMTLPDSYDPPSLPEGHEIAIQNV